MSEEKLREYSIQLFYNLVLFKTGKLSLEEYEKIITNLKKQYEER